MVMTDGSGLREAFAAAKLMAVIMVASNVLACSVDQVRSVCSVSLLNRSVFRANVVSVCGLNGMFTVL